MTALPVSQDHRSAFFSLIASSFTDPGSRSHQIIPFVQHSIDAPAALAAGAHHGNIDGLAGVAAFSPSEGARAWDVEEGRRAGMEAEGVIPGYAMTHFHRSMCPRWEEVGMAVEG